MCAQKTTQICLPIRTIVVHMKKLYTLGYPNCVQWRFWTDCAHTRRFVIWPCDPFIFFFNFVVYNYMLCRMGCLIVLTLVLLNPDISWLWKQCRSRSVGFWRSQLRSQLSWFYNGPLSMWLCINNQDQVILLVRNEKWAGHLNLFSKIRVKWQNMLEISSDCP